MVCNHQNLKHSKLSILAYLCEWYNALIKCSCHRGTFLVWSFFSGLEFFTYLPVLLLYLNLSTNFLFIPAVAMGCFFPEKSAVVY